METSNKSARELYEIVKADRSHQRLVFGRKPALVNVDLQNAYTRPDEFPTAYETDPRQIEHVNALAKLFRAKDCPVIWTYVAYLESGEDCGVWGTRSDTPDSLQNIKEGSRRAAIDERCEIDRRDIVINKRMASAFFETNLGSLFTWHKVDTLIVTGGSTSGCVRATVVDSLSRGFRTVVPEECVSDRHESPHFANLYDMSLKYADVMPVAEVIAFMGSYEPPPK
jgi:maleamate amidohydrolase